MNPTLLGIVMIFGGLGLASGGVIVLMKRVEESPSGDMSSSTVVVTDLDPGRETTTLTTEEKGRKFEEWVAKRFSPDYFTIREWRGDKYVDGIYPKSSTNPDLEVEFHLRDVRSLFAVECKYRSGYQQGVSPYIIWASDRQIENYRSFAKTRNMPVFVVIGIGGQADNPDEVFVVNLRNLRYSKARSDYLARFRRKNKDQDFYYDYKKPDLQ